MSFLEVITVCLGSYGLAFTLANLPGPFGLASSLKELLSPYGVRREWIRHGMNCPICLSCWFAIPMSVLISPSVGVRDVVICSCCATGFASVVYMLSPPAGSD